MNRHRSERGQVRIIAGRWRGRRLRFPARLGLRPTPDRVRETLFNWLAPYVNGARCLDLFAGSGALGMEALSRGAACVYAVERDPVVASALRRNATQLQAVGMTIDNRDVMRVLSSAEAPRCIDLVFLDPPYDAGLYEPVASAVEACLNPQALIYVEAERHRDLQCLPAHWRVHRSGRAGQLEYQLLQRSVTSSVKDD